MDRPSLFGTGDGAARWLRATDQLDINSPAIQAQIRRLVQPWQNERERAIAIHHHVRSIPFGLADEFHKFKASACLKLGYGDNLTKGVIFVAMLRAANIAARLRFVELPSGLLMGLKDHRKPTIVHAIAEVLLDRRPHQVDTYVLDPYYRMAALERLRQQYLRVGFGAHVNGAMTWDGNSDGLSTFATGDAASLPVDLLGVGDDVRSFFGDQGGSKFLGVIGMRLMNGFASLRANRRIDAMRSSYMRAHDLVANEHTQEMLTQHLDRRPEAFPSTVVLSRSPQPTILAPQPPPHGVDPRLRRVFR